MNKKTIICLILLLIYSQAQVQQQQPQPTIQQHAHAQQSTQQQQQYKLVFITEPPDPQEPFLGMPQGIQLRRMTRALCAQDPQACNEQKLVFTEWCRLDQEWCKDSVQTEALYHKLCPQYPKLCIPDPQALNPSHPTGIVLDDLIAQICQKDPHFCLSLRSKYEEYCLDDPRWCVLDTQDYAIYLFYCKSNAKFCSQANVDKSEQKLMLAMMKKELKQMCARDKLLCKNIKKRHIKQCPKNKLYCTNPNRILDTYIQLCEKYPKFCHQEVFTWANEKHAMVFF